MTIECYLSECPHHSCHDGLEGPFCDEKECRATGPELENLQQLRKKRLAKLFGEDEED